MTANEITNRLLIAIPKAHPNVLCWRNNTGGGVGWSVVKAAIRLMRDGNVDGAINLLRRPIKFGLVGSSDILCVLGGKHRGRLLALEIKDPDTHDEQSPAQMSFEARIKALGAAYILCESVEQALADIAVEVEG